MNLLDILLLVILAMAALLGLKRGLIGTILSLVGLLLGVVLAGRFHGPVGNFLSRWISNPDTASIVGFAVIFVATMVAAWLVASFLRRFISMLLLGWVDRIGGALFGLATAATFCGAALAMLIKFNVLSAEGVTADSTLARFLVKYFPLVLNLLPGGFGDAARNFFGG